ncbi:retrovirus-related pol polyprotein from transposon TNT 1-94 [Tanacetum coccineum]
MLIGEKVNSSQKTQESKYDIPQSESAKSGYSSKDSQESKPKVLNTDSSKSLRPKPIQKPKLKYHDMYVASLRRSKNYTAQPYQYASPSKQILKTKATHFPPSTHCGFNDHRPGDYRNYPECEICKSYDHITSGHNRVILRHIREPIWYLDSGCSRSMTGVKSYLHKYVEQPGPKFADKQGTIFKANKEIMLIASRRNDVYVLDMTTLTPNGPCFFAKASESDHLGKFDVKANDGYFLGYSFVSKAFRVFNTRRQQIEETYHVTFNESMEAIKLTNTSVDEIGIDDSSLYPPNKFLHKDDPFRQYQANFDFSYYIIPHGRSLTELTKDTHVPEDEQVKSQLTEEPSGINTEISVPNIKPSVPEVTQSQIT